MSFGGFAHHAQQGHPGHPIAPPRSSKWLSRLGWFFLFITPLAVVITATQVTPAASGMGTHQQLGLPPCGFLVVTGIPCPGCGLTTSFAHMVRGQFTGATFANPFGVMLFMVTFFTIPIAVTIGKRAGGASVLDVFCCTGGFSVHAAAGGAKVGSADRLYRWYRPADPAEQPGLGARLGSGSGSGAGALGGQLDSARGAGDLGREQ